MVAALAYFQIGGAWERKKILSFIPLPIGIRILRYRYSLFVLIEVSQYFRKEGKVMVTEDGIGFLQFHILAISLGQASCHNDLCLGASLLESEESVYGLFFCTLNKATGIDYHNVGILRLLDPDISFVSCIGKQHFRVNLILCTP